MSYDNQSTTTFPFKTAEEMGVYSESIGEYQLVIKKVYCKYCKYRTETTLLGPKCGNCRANLIMIPKHELA